jgi:hypothetical protein
MSSWALIFRGEELRVILPDNSFVAVRYNAAMTILQLKSDVERQMGFPRGLQVLYLDTSTEQMINQQTLESYGIKQDTNVYLVGVHYLLDEHGFFHFRATAIV